MKRLFRPFRERLLLALIASAALVAFLLWLRIGGGDELSLRVPGTDQGPEGSGAAAPNPVLAGKRTQGSGSPGTLAGDWPQFRGPERNGISPEKASPAPSPTNSPLRELWSIDVGEGYAGAAIQGGRVFLMDYDQEKRQDALRCLSFDDGQEIWRFSYPVTVKRNHGMSRTVPAVSSNLVVAIGPKCHVVAVDPNTGDLRWGIDMVRQFGSTVPPWYAGQCPLIEDGNVILAPAGPDALLAAVDGRSGEVVWTSPNPRSWKMTHSSIMVMEVDRERMYVYCGDRGVVGVSARDGSILWDTVEWKISIANVPSPVVLDGGRVFLSGGYNAGSMMLQIKREGGSFKAETLFRLGPQVFGATQQTPIYYQGDIYGVRPDGKFACLNTEGTVLWTSEGKSFGLGPFVIGYGLIYAVNDSGLLRVFEATPEKYALVSQAQILNGREAWAPLALTAGRLLARDLTRLVCLEVR